MKISALPLRKTYIVFSKLNSKPIYGSDGMESMFLI